MGYFPLVFACVLQFLLNFGIYWKGRITGKLYLCPAVDMSLLTDCHVRGWVILIRNWAGLGIVISTISLSALKPSSTPLVCLVWSLEHQRAFSWGSWSVFSFQQSLHLHSTKWLFLHAQVPLSSRWLLLVTCGRIEGIVSNLLVQFQF